MKNLKLNNLEQNQLSSQELNNLKGGYTCGCGCIYANQGGSSVMDNTNANAKIGAGGKTPNQQMYVQVYK